MVNYLTNMPDILEKYGMCKTLYLRREMIHIKHIFTEIFVRKNIDLRKYLDLIGMDLWTYMEFMTNRVRWLHKISRNYVNDVNDIVKQDRANFFNTLKLYTGLRNGIVLDFDGVITSKKFRDLYHLCLERHPGKVIVCTANPEVDYNWFLKRGYELPSNIYAVHGKVKKLRTLINLSKHYDNMFYIDNEMCYLEVAWVFGINTYHYRLGKVKNFSLNA